MDRAHTNPDTLYLTDNGAALCGAHLGMTARFSGRDISGQKIHRVTVDDNAHFVRECSKGITCEQCGKGLTSPA